MKDEIGTNLSADLMTVEEAGEKLIKSVRRMEIKEDDVIVVTLDPSLDIYTKDQRDVFIRNAERIKKTIENATAHIGKVEVLVVHGAELAVMSKEEAKETLG